MKHYLISMENCNHLLALNYKILHLENIRIKTLHNHDIVKYKRHIIQEML